MKISRQLVSILSALAVICGAFFLKPLQPALAQADTETPVPPTATSTSTPVYSFTVSPVSDERWAQPGTIVTFPVTVTNTGDADVIAVSPSGPWNTWTSVTSLSLAVGASATLTVYVSIPADAAAGAAETATINFNSSGFSQTAQFTARAVPPTPTPPSGTNRPLMVIDSYGGGEVNPGKDFNLDLTFANRGSSSALNVIVTFEATGIYPRDTGGVQVIGSLAAGKKAGISQPMSAGKELSGPTPVAVKIAYSDAQGTAYTETFTLTLAVTGYYGGGGVVKPTATGTSQPRPQLVVTGYETNLDPLQPGLSFALKLKIANLGAADARSVAMVLGGASPSSADSGSGTPAPGGVQGSGSDLTNFAPLGSSNIFYLNDVRAGQALEADYQLIVNVSTNPGAYPLKISFVYDDAKGNRLIDDQVITLLVYTLPQVEISFYSSVEGLMVGQPGMLPMQVTNLGRKPTVLGSMKVTAQNAELTNNSSLVGVLDSGGYFTFDAQITPMQAGTLPLEITINYTDDFNRLRTITQSLEVQVAEAPPLEEMGPLGPDGLPIPQTPVQEPETFWQKVLRFAKGLLGLDSAQPQPTLPEMGPIPEPDMEKPMPLGPKG